MAVTTMAFAIGVIVISLGGFPAMNKQKDKAEDAVHVEYEFVRDTIPPNVILRGKKNICIKNDNSYASLTPYQSYKLASTMAISPLDDTTTNICICGYIDSKVRYTDKIRYLQCNIENGKLFIYNEYRLVESDDYDPAPAHIFYKITLKQKVSSVYILFCQIRCTSRGIVELLKDKVISDVDFSIYK